MSNRNQIPNIDIVLWYLMSYISITSEVLDVVFGSEEANSNMIVFNSALQLQSAFCPPRTPLHVQENESIGDEAWYPYLSSIDVHPEVAAYPRIDVYPLKTLKRSTDINLIILLCISTQMSYANPTESVSTTCL